MVRMLTKKRWGQDVKNKAREMRLKGATYSEIGKSLGVVKSTLNVWFKGMPETDHLYYTDRISWMKKIQAMSSIAIRRKRDFEVKEIFKKVDAEVEKWNFIDSFEMGRGILSVLYLAEGAKAPIRGTSVKFTNTDPKLIYLFLTLLRKCYKIDENKLRVALHVHWYHDTDDVRRYWSKLLRVEESKFFKVYVKKRSETKKFRKNFAGICTVVYYSVDLRWELVQTGYNMAERITGSLPEYNGV